MLISRLCRVGFRVAKELSRGGYAYMSRSRYKQRHCSHYQWSTLELLPETRAFQGSIFQKHHGFSTLASDGASAGAMKRKERYLSHLFQRMEKKFPFKCLLECPCWKQLMKML
ncbi:hypothetical protein ES288_A06G096600v1 [Gossypium darwinii]|uniref:Uncharacterized protein n=1 Tax=Gossypium darwinii TaxID=34276 RepID=A0A5D2G4W0_GOSDA|nr:hypothetical protein ES288_A06G096600v1 [Gossypium darwinii]